MAPVLEAAPGSPWRPVGPVLPVAPVLVAVPETPVGPVQPVQPVGPVAPVFVAVPTGPVQPVNPVGPVAPVFVAVPAGPVHPVHPVGPLTPVGPTDNRVMFAVVPARIVATDAPSTWKLSLSPAARSMNIKSGITIGVVTIVIGLSQYTTPFFRIRTLPGVPVIPPSMRIMNSIAYAPVSATAKLPVVCEKVTRGVLALYVPVAPMNISKSSGDDTLSLVRVKLRKASVLPPSAPVGPVMPVGPVAPVASGPVCP